MVIKYSKFNPSKVLNYFKWFNDADVVFGLSPYTPRGLFSIAKWSTYVWLNRNKKYLFINCDGLTIGHVGLTLNKDVKKEGEISLVIGEAKYWNCGIGRMAILEIIDVAKKNKITKIIARISDENIISIRLFSSLNFMPNGKNTIWEDKTFVHYVNMIKTVNLVKSCNT